MNFDWATADCPEREFSDERQLGFIAQEVEEVAPEAVSTDAEGYKYLDYGKLVPLLTEAVKQQQSIIERQQALLLHKQRDIASLKASLRSDR